MLEKCLDLKSKNSSFKMILKIPGLIENNICIRGGWETGLANLMLSMAGNSNTVIDIGANIGYHTLYLASSAGDVRCIGFEPNPGIYEEFKRNIGINGFANVTAYPYAVGDKCGVTEFYATNETAVNRGLSAINCPGNGSGYSKITVKLITLDSFLDDAAKENTRVLKIDAQGYEYQVISGALDLIKKSQPVIFMEYHEESEKTPREIFDLIPDYRIFTVDAWSGEVKEYEKSDNKCCTDFLCVPPRVDFLG